MDKLELLIKNSTLTNADKTSFLNYISHLSKKEQEEIFHLLNKEDADFILSFWKTLEKKLFLIYTLNKTDIFSQKAKEDIIDQISKMNTQEFNTFFETLTSLNDKKIDPKEQMDRISEEFIKNHKDITQQD